jgi:uncharacterized protein YqfA (UPF0365 family)
VTVRRDPGGTYLGANFNGASSEGETADPRSMRTPELEAWASDAVQRYGSDRVVVTHNVARLVPGMG